MHGRRSHMTGTRGNHHIRTTNREKIRVNNTIMITRGKQRGQDVHEATGLVHKCRKEGLIPSETNDVDKNRGPKSSFMLRT